MTEKLILPTLDLFRYDLASNVAAGDRVAPDRRENFEEPFDGYFKSYEIEDAVLLRTNTSGKKVYELFAPREIDGSFLKAQALDRANEKQQQPGNLGESWLFWGQSVEGTGDRDARAQVVAKAAYESLQLTPILNWETDLQGRGRAAGASLFELARFSDDRAEDFHLWICLADASNDPIASLEAIEREILLHHLQRLALYHHKILYAYVQGERLRNGLSSLRQDIDGLLKIQKSRMQSFDLAGLLRAASGYNIGLIELEEQHTTADINLENYRKRSQAMQSLPGSENLDFLDAFATLAENKFLRQLERDAQSFAPGLKLLENTAKTVEHAIALEQSRRDRNTELTLAIVGAGLAASSVTVAALVEEVPEGQTWQEFYGRAIGGSLGMGIVASLLVWFLLSRFRRPRK